MLPKFIFLEFMQVNVELLCFLAGMEVYQIVVVLFKTRPFQHSEGLLDIFL